MIKHDPEAVDREGEEKREGYGWAAGLGIKVLEVRTPSWRSAKVSDISPSHLASQIQVPIVESKITFTGIGK